MSLINPAALGGVGPINTARRTPVSTCPNLNLPKTWQWNFAVEQALGGSQSLTATYLDAAGRGLFTSEVFASLNSRFMQVIGTNCFTPENPADHPCA